MNVMPNRQTFPARTISPLEIYSGYYCNNPHSLIFYSPKKGDIELFFGEKFVDEKTAKKMLRAKKAIKKEPEEVKICFECPPQKFKQLFWTTTHYHGSAFDGTTYYAPHSALILPDNLELKVYELELKFDLNATQRTNARKEIKQLDLELSTEQLNLALFYEHKKPIYNYVYFTLCAEHQRKSGKVAKNIIRSLAKVDRPDWFSGYPHYDLYSLGNISYRISRTINATQLRQTKLELPEGFIK